MLSSSISPIALHQQKDHKAYLGAKMQWICGFLCEKCQKGDPPPKKGVIFIDFWKFTPQRAGTLFRVSRGTPRVLAKKRQKTRFLTPISLRKPRDLTIFDHFWSNLQKNDLFWSFCGFSLQVLVQRAVCGIYATKSTYKSIFYYRFFCLLLFFFVEKSFS